MRVVGLLLATWLAVCGGVASAMPRAGTILPARPSSAVVSAIKEALGTPEAVMQILRDHELTVNSPLTGKNETLLHLIAGMPDDTASLATLDHVLEQEGEGVSVNAVDSDGKRPLHHAAKLGKQLTVERLLSKNAHVNLQDNEEKTPINHAEDEGHNDLAALLSTYAEGQGDFFDPEEEGAAPGVPDFLINLNEMAAAGLIDPVVGRVNEIMSVFEAVSLRRKNNPLLIGPAGVGKTAIAEGIAILIERGEVPAEFADKTLYNIDIGTLTAGTGGRGELEERVATLLNFAKHNPDALFFIDEVHLIAAGGATGGIDLASLLKPALARGELRTIGATTDEEYRRHILNDKALNRRFSVIRVEEPNLQEALEIAFAARDYISAHHGIEITDEAVIAAVELAYHLHEQKQPDVSITLLDEAAAALKYDSGRLKLFLTDIVDKITRRSDRLPYGNNERKKQVKSEIDELKISQEQHQTELDEHIDSKLAEQEQRVNEIEEKADEDEGILAKAQKKLKKLFSRKRLEAHHIAALISRKLGIPVEKILKTEQANLVNLEANLKKHILGQDESVNAIVDTVTVSYAGIGQEGRVLGSFMITGPTGVGKSFTAQMLAELIFGDQRHLIRFDMSEYMEGHTLSTLLGAPPGYVGYEEGGELTKKVLANPHAVILFDEVEKAHPRFQNILLQILEGARLTDRSGETVDFSNTIIIMTSNSTDLQSDFRPEVRNRIDNILTYDALSPEVMGGLVQAQLNMLNERLEEQKVVIELSEDAVASLSEDGYDPEFGARPLQRLFNQRIRMPLAKMIVNGQLKEGTTYIIDIDENGKLDLQTKE